ncbi:Histidine--tRNA ligase [bioreactor metagenome]|uniref:histidine--tRNA ligase n=1 Tax=bioreactor metagenome TaxID=1076179 RepID=A0A644ZGG5_9ZZZZ
MAQPDEKLSQVLNALKDFDIPQTAFVFDPSLVRGCDYYTSTIFEVQVPEANGSIGGGGRYDNLIETLGGPSIPAVGFSFGFERLVDVIQDLKLIPKENQNNIKILIANLGEETQKEIINLTKQLRQNNISSIIYPDNEKLGKQIKYALNLGISYLAIIGTDEAKNNQITLKNLATTDQQTVSLKELVDML